MDLDPFWHHGGLAADVYTELLREESRLQIFKPQQTPQKRRQMIEWMLKTGRSMEKKEGGVRVEFNPCSLHLAVYFYDVFIGHLAAETPPSVLFVGAAVCLLLAAKIEEQDKDTPKPSAFRRRVSQLGAAFDFELKEYLNMEREILRLLEWRLMLLPTAPHFVPYLMTMAIDPLTDPPVTPPQTPRRQGFKTPVQPKRGELGLLGSPEGEIPDQKTRLELHTYKFLELTLKDIYFRTLAPSKVTAACVALAREKCGLTPNWPIQLQTLTGFNTVDIDGPIQFLNHMKLDGEARRVSVKRKVLQTPTPPDPAPRPRWAYSIGSGPLYIPVFLPPPDKRASAGQDPAPMGKRVIKVKKPYSWQRPPGLQGSRVTQYEGASGRKYLLVLPLEEEEDEEETPVKKTKIQENASA